MFRKLVLFIIVLMCPVFVLAEETKSEREISGIVTCPNFEDKMAPCAAVTVSCSETTTKGVATVLDGKFLLKCPSTEGVLISYVGMDDKKISVAELDKQSTGLKIELSQKVTGIESVVIDGKNLEGTSCEHGDPHAKSAKKSLCSKNPGVCEKGATGYACLIEDCQKGWVPNKTNNVCDNENCINAGGTWDASAQKCNGATKCPKGKEWNDKLNKCFDEVIKKRKDEEIKELEENAQAMKDKEQSTANKLLGGASMAATGVGGMMLAQSMAEQGADADAEMDMRAYLETFVCKYADGKSFKGGTENIELPGGNDLLPLYTEYVNLANDLKIRKEALGMRPGIESEKILDNATSGLYDDVALGKTGGAYASLARALQDPEGEDAKMWAEQKDKTKKNLIAGIALAGIGAVGGIVGNAIINKDAAKESSAAIKAKYAKMKEEVEQVAAPLLKPQSLPVENKTKKCTDYEDAKGTFPDCVCKDKKTHIFSEDKGCTPCEENYHNVNNECKCKLKGDLVNEETCKCVTNAVEIGGVCKCKDGFEDKGNKGACNPKTEPVVTPAQECNIQDNDPLKRGSECKCMPNAGFREGKCQCDTNYTQLSGACICPAPYTEEGNKCECKLSGKVKSGDGVCACVDNAETEKGKTECKCKTGYHDPNESGTCVKKPAEKVEEEPKETDVVFQLNFLSDYLFEFSKSELTEEAKKTLAQIGKKIEDNFNPDDADFKITIVGHTDRVKFKKGSKMNNKILSERRAEAVLNAMLAGVKEESLITNFVTEGKADAECSADKFTNPKDENCRKVVITATVKSGKQNIVEGLSKALGDVTGGKLEKFHVSTKK